MRARVTIWDDAGEQRELYFGTVSAVDDGYNDDGDYAITFSIARGSKETKEKDGW
jgi:hypothetical protein